MNVPENVFEQDPDVARITPRRRFDRSSPGLLPPASVMNRTVSSSFSLSFSLSSIPRSLSWVQKPPRGCVYPLPVLI